jgi:hypothetical protein
LKSSLGVKLATRKVMAGLVARLYSTTRNRPLSCDLKEAGGVRAQGGNGSSFASQYL